MESLMREVSGGDVVDGAKASGEATERTAEEQEKERMFKAAWEAMLIEGMNGQEVAGMEDFWGHGGAGKKEIDGAGETDDFQKTIRHAMEKLKESESTLQVAFIFCWYK
jgi:peroxin-19